MPGGKGTVEWDQLATWERLVAAIYASGTKVRHESPQCLDRC